MSTFEIESGMPMPVEIVVRNLLREAGGKPSQELLRMMFDYDPSGCFVRKLSRNGRNHQIGSIAKATLNIPDGYLRLNIGGTHFMLHILVWVWHYGFYPENKLDHINRNKLDNRIENLREVSAQCNARNSSTSIISKSKIKGVYLRSRDASYSAEIKLGGRVRYLIQTKDLTEAVCHRYAAEQCLNWNDCDLNSSAYQYLKSQGVVK